MAPTPGWGPCTMEEHVVARIKAAAAGRDAPRVVGGYPMAPGEGRVRLINAIASGSSTQRSRISSR